MSDKIIEQPSNAFAAALDKFPIEIAEKVLVSGDLAGLSSAQRLEYYRRLCLSLNLNPLTRPFEYITLNNKLTLYAKKDATEQLRRTFGVSISILSREIVKDNYLVVASAILGTRQDESIGAVSIGGLAGNDLANAIMKAETKAKRRVTLSICGLGMLDETELETIPTAKPFQPLPDPDRVTKQTKKADVIAKKTPEQMIANDPLTAFDNLTSDQVQAATKAAEEDISDLLNAELPEDGHPNLIPQSDGTMLLKVKAVDYISKNGENKAWKMIWADHEFFVPKSHSKLTDQGLIVSKWWFEKNREKMGL